MRKALVSVTKCRLAGWGRMIIEVGAVREPPLQLHKHNSPRAGGACVPTV